MKSTQFRKNIWLMPLAGLAVITAPFIAPDTQPPAENHFLKEVKAKIKSRESNFPGDRLYLASDKPFYAPGDDIWFSVFVRNESDLLPSQKSDVVEAQLIGPKGNVEKHVKLIARNGVAAGDFALDPTLPGGLYRLRAFTQWMKNVSDTNNFEREIQVQDVVLPNLKMSLEFTRKAYGPGDDVMARVEIHASDNKPLAAQPVTLVCSVNGSSVAACTNQTAPDGIQFLKFTLPRKLQKSDVLVNVMTLYNGSTESISRAVPVVLNHLKLQFLPEGGDMVSELPARIAFRATNEWGKAADVEGEVYNSKGARVATFSSLHQGMGSFLMVPDSNESYYAAITVPAGITGTFSLPESLPRGYAMQCEQPAKERLAVTIQSTEETELSFIAQVRGIVYYSTVIHAMKGENRFEFRTHDFPAGVAQLTLFDGRNVPRCERLVFVNRDRRMNITISTDKQQYLPREKVRVTVSARDEKGMPVPAIISLRAVDDQLLSFADDKSGNIQSQLLLESDLREKVEDPSFYFRQYNVASAKALDHLLLTSGWRRFTWEEIIDGKLPAVLYKGEKAIIAGKVRDGRTGHPLAAKIMVPTLGEVVCGEDGSFAIKGFDLSQPAQFTVTAAGYSQQFFWPEEYGDNVVINLYDNKYRMMEQRVNFAEMAGVPMAATVADNSKMAAKPKRPGQKPLPKPAEKPRRMDHRRALTAGADILKDLAIKEIPRQAKYHRARAFAPLVYKVSETPAVRSDFRSLLYWNPNIEVGYSGKKTLEFYTSDQISSYRIIAEGISRDGMAGQAGALFYTQLPFTVQLKMPAQLVAGDKLSLDIVLKNNTPSPIGGVLDLQLPEVLKLSANTPSVQTLMPGASKVVHVKCSVLPVAGVHTVHIGFNACSLSDAITHTMNVVNNGFPAPLSFSSQDADREFVFETQHTVPGSMRIKVMAFPDVVSDLLTGVEGILQEPYGCFEQTSCTAYPNAMVLKYLKTAGNNDARLLAHAGGLLERGYKRLTTFETPRNGYEWFGAVPAHEGLTAYGIMEFADMKRAGQAIDQKMFDRTLQWLLSKRDGQGGFQREQHALHDFGRVSTDVMNAYIVYALADAGCHEIRREFAATFETSMKSGDAYLVALSANAAYALNEKAKGELALKKLNSLRKPDGSFEGTSHSITYSQGKALQIETTALALMAMLKSPEKDAESISKCVRFIISSRSGSGTFSSTQSTILALKALSEYAAFSKRTAADGEITVYLDGKSVGRHAFKAGETAAITIDGIEKHLKSDGKHTIRVKFTGGHLPYSIAIDRNTMLPVSDTSCALALQVKIPRPAVASGETVRMQVVLHNRKSEPVPSAVAVIGIPAGAAVQPWQLKDLQEKKVFDYYEISGNSLFLYYRGMAPGAVKEINLDLKTVMTGEFGAPASCAYLYYTNEHKSWTSGVSLSIK